MCTLSFTYINELPNMNSRLEICPQGPSKLYDSICLNNVLASNRRQIIIWINDCLVFWRIYASLGVDELTWMTQRLQNHKHVPLMYVGTALCIPYIACHEVTGSTKPFCVTDIHCCVTCNHSLYMYTFSSSSLDSPLLLFYYPAASKIASFVMTWMWPLMSGGWSY